MSIIQWVLIISLPEKSSLLTIVLHLLLLLGGVGTLDEFFEIFTLMQTGKIKKRPIVLYDSSYWANLLQQLEEMKGYTISLEDMDLIEIIDNPQKIISYLKQNVKTK